MNKKLDFMKNKIKIKDCTSKFGVNIMTAKVYSTFYALNDMSCAILLTNIRKYILKKTQKSICLKWFNSI